MASQQTYEQQIEAGKEIVKEALRRLAGEIGRQEIREFKFIVTDRDFDHRQISVLDPNQKKIVLKLAEDDLADAPGTAAVRYKLETQLHEAVGNHYKI